MYSIQHTHAEFLRSIFSTYTLVALIEVTFTISDFVNMCEVRSVDVCLVKRYLLYTFVNNAIL